MRWQSLKKPAAFIALLVVYVVVGKLSLRLAVVHPSATVVWPPSGIALAAIVLLGYEVWPAILLGAFLVNASIGPIAPSAGIAVGNTCEALLGAYLITRFAHGVRAFDRARDILKFAGLAAILSTITSATIGVATLCLSGSANWLDYRNIWVTWWLGDVVGVALVAPALILWGTNYSVHDKRDHFFEAATLLACFILLSELAFDSPVTFTLSHLVFGLACIPLLVWAIFRFGPRETALAVLVMSVVAIRGALRGMGPFAQSTEQESLVLVQVVTGVTSLLALTVAAIVYERKRLEEIASHLAAVVEGSYDAIISKTTGGIIESWNKGAEQIYGYTAGEAVGQPITILSPPHLLDELRQILAAVNRGEVIRDYETERLRKDGTTVDISLTVSPVRDSGGKVTGSSVIARDISSRKEGEVAMREANQSLKAWVNRLKRQTQEIALLNQLIQLLQTCQVPDEIYAVSRRFAEQLFPGVSGAVCVLNTTVNWFETVVAWGNIAPGDQLFASQECWALRRGMVHSVSQSNDPLICQHLGPGGSVKYMCVPMVAQGETIGVLHLREDGEASREDVSVHAPPALEQLAGTVAGHIALALANLRLRDTLRAQSIRDPLTGLYNRRYLKDSLEREIRRASRSQRPLAAIMLDIDYFKQFNDTLGHDAGDALLRELGNLLQSRLRGEDIPCRYGGDEFVIILAEASRESVVRRARQIQEAIKRLSISHGGKYLEAPTVSLGVAFYPEHGETAESLLHAADEALYRAKFQGRDRVVVGQTGEID